MRIKWLNVILAIIFVISCLVVLKDAITIATSLTSFTLYGVITNVLALTLIGTIGDYLYEEMQ